MLELYLLLFIAFCLGGFFYGIYVYIILKLGAKRCKVYTLINDKNEFLGYEVVDDNKTVSRFMGEQKLIEPLLLEFLKGKTFVEAKR